MMTLFQRLTLIALMVSIAGCSSLIGATSEKPVQFNPGKRTLGTVIDDEQLETAATVNLDKASPYLKQAHLNVTAFNGIVLLTGQVANQNLRETAGSVVAQIHGVRQVFNEVEVQGKTSLLARSNDTWLTTKVKSSLMARKDLDSSRIKVVTENGVVFLMGLLSRTEADKAASVTSNIKGVRKVVKAVEYIQ